jgi:hypothetical protein
MELSPIVKAMVKVDLTYGDLQAAYDDITYADTGKSEETLEAAYSKAAKRYNAAVAHLDTFETDPGGKCYKCKAPNGFTGEGLALCIGCDYKADSSDRSKA